MLHSVLLEFQHIALGVFVVWPNALCLACRWHALINDRLSLLGRYGLCLTCSGGPISFSLGLSLLMRGWCVARVERVLAYMCPPAGVHRLRRCAVSHTASDDCTVKVWRASSGERSLPFRICFAFTVEQAPSAITVSVVVVVDMCARAQQADPFSVKRNNASFCIF